MWDLDRIPNGIYYKELGVTPILVIYKGGEIAAVLPNWQANISTDKEGGEFMVERVRR